MYLTGILIRLDHERGDCLVQPFLTLQPDLRLIIPVAGMRQEDRYDCGSYGVPHDREYCRSKFAGALPIQKRLLFLAHDLEFHADLLEIVSACIR